MRTGVRAFLAVAALLVLAACGNTRENPYTSPAGDDDISIEILNNNFADATVWAIRLGQRVRLGIVYGNQSETFRMRWTSSVPIQLELRLVGGVRCLTEEIPTDPGDHLYLEIDQNIERDPDCVRRDGSVSIR